MKVQTLKDILSDYHRNDEVEICFDGDLFDIVPDRVYRDDADHSDGTPRNDLWLTAKDWPPLKETPEWNTQENYNRLLNDKKTCGSFQHALIECFFKADNNNKVALVNAFPSYFIPKA
jgi:hypothetical protein